MRECRRVRGWKRGRYLEQVQILWRKAAAEGCHKLLTDMVEAAYVDLESRQVVGVTPKGHFRHAFAALGRTVDGPGLMPPNNPDETRGRGIAPVAYGPGGDGGNPSQSQQPQGSVPCGRGGGWVPVIAPAAVAAPSMASEEHAATTPTLAARGQVATAVANRSLKEHPAGKPPLGAPPLLPESIL